MFLDCALLSMKCSLVISHFLEEISSLSHSIVFLYFFALFTWEGFPISPRYSLEFPFSWVYLSFSPLPFASLLFPAIFKASSDNHFAFSHFFFLGMVLITAFCTMSSFGYCSLFSVPLYSKTLWKSVMVWLIT